MKFLTAILFMLTGCINYNLLKVEDTKENRMMLENKHITEEWSYARREGHGKHWYALRYQKEGKFLVVECMKTQREIDFHPGNPFSETVVWLACDDLK